jgi:hypothetical protein
MAASHCEAWTISTRRGPRTSRLALMTSPCHAMIIRTSVAMGENRTPTTVRQMPCTCACAFHTTQSHARLCAYTVAR